MKLLGFTKYRTLNFLCIFTHCFMISFFTFIFSTQWIFHDAEWVWNIFLCFVAFGCFAFIYYYIFIPLLVLPIVVEIFLIKRGWVKPLIPIANKKAQIGIITSTIMIIIFFYMYAYRILIAP